MAKRRIEPARQAARGGQSDGGVTTPSAALPRGEGRGNHRLRQSGKGEQGGDGWPDCGTTVMARAAKGRLTTTCTGAAAAQFTWLLEMPLGGPVMCVR